MKTILLFLAFSFPYLCLGQKSLNDDEQILRAEHRVLLSQQDHLQSELSNVNVKIDSVLALLYQFEWADSEKPWIKAAETVFLWNDYEYSKRKITVIPKGSEVLRLIDPPVKGYQKVLFNGEVGWVREGLMIPLEKENPPLNIVNPPAVRATSRSSSTARTRSCCKVCTKGKPCGNSCISRSYTCRKPPGCAC